MKTHLFNAIREGNKVSVSEILDKQPSLVNEKDERGSTPLLLATYYGHKDVSAEILKRAPS